MIAISYADPRIVHSTNTLNILIFFIKLVLTIAKLDLTSISMELQLLLIFNHAYTTNTTTTVYSNYVYLSVLLYLETGTRKFPKAT